ncbi:MAG: GAF domain-containing protein [Cyanobacteria bacterium P01_A01_bin.17]
MTRFHIPSVLSQVFNRSDDAETVFSELMPVLGSLLQCDRIFLYLRHPDNRMGCTPFCWQQSEEVPSLPDSYSAQWSLEDPQQLEQKDPLFAAALTGKPSIFIEDIEAAANDIINKELEHQQFGHRALAHAHLSHDHQLWGILEPCMFDQPRTWTAFDQALINYTVAQSELLAVNYVKEHHAQ